MDFPGTIDILFVILYLLIIAGISVWSIRKSKASPSDYFLANRSLDGELLALLYLPEM
ncbi:MAG: hypothetical protein ABIO55_09180 [Ginsengibacter sp.]